MQHPHADRGGAIVARAGGLPAPRDDGVHHEPHSPPDPRALLRGRGLLPQGPEPLTPSSPAPRVLLLGRGRRGLVLLLLGHTPSLRGRCLVVVPPPGRPQQQLPELERQQQQPAQGQRGGRGQLRHRGRRRAARAPQGPVQFSGGPQLPSCELAFAGTVFTHRIRTAGWFFSCSASSVSFRTSISPGYSHLGSRLSGFNRKKSVKYL